MTKDSKAAKEKRLAARTFRRLQRGQPISTDGLLAMGEAIEKALSPAFREPNQSVYLIGDNSKEGLGIPPPSLEL
jgi:hypothetical protein